MNKDMEQIQALISEGKTGEAILLFQELDVNHVYKTESTLLLSQLSDYEKNIITGVHADIRTLNEIKRSILELTDKLKKSSEESRSIIGGEEKLSNTKQVQIIEEPLCGQIIDHRLDFIMKFDIPNFDENAHYWTAITTAKTKKDWYKLDIEQRKNDENFITTLNQWQIDLVWPKFYIKSNPGSGHIYDGGSNQNPFLQAMVLLILKVDEGTNSFIINWHKAQKYYGIPLHRLNGDVISKCPIFFP